MKFTKEEMLESYRILLKDKRYKYDEAQQKVDFWADERYSLWQQICDYEAKLEALGEEST